MNNQTLIDSETPFIASLAVKPLAEEEPAFYNSMLTVNGDNNNRNGIQLKNIIEPNKENLIQYTFAEQMRKSKLLPDPQCLLGNYLNKGEIALLAGRTGIGKSILSYQIAMGASEGKPILEQKNDCGQMRVLLYDFELTLVNLKRRYANYQPNENFFRPDIDDILLKYNGAFNCNIIEEDIIKIKPELIIIDNITAISLKATSDGGEALSIMKQLKYLQSKYNLTILVVAHTPKLYENKPLEVYQIAGSSTIHNFIDTAIMIGKSSKGKDQRYIKKVKSRNNSDCEEVIQVKITDQPCLQFEFVDFNSENEHILLTAESEGYADKASEKLLSTANEIFGDKPYLLYSEICNRYAELCGKSFDTGKRLFYKLKDTNLITKTPDGKWTLNRNETSLQERDYNSRGDDEPF